jgi:ribosomal-protein-alanine N-acetyltransferase
MPLPTPTLHTARLLLRPFTQADTDTMLALHSSPRVLRYRDAPPWKERAQADHFIAACRQIEQEGTGARLAIERAADGVFIGWCCLVTVSCESEHQPRRCRVPRVKGESLTLACL